MANALLMSKVNYNIEIWGDTSKTNRNKIDNIIYKAANIILGKEAIGRTKEWKLTKLKWLNIETNYRNAMQNSIYRMINSENNHDFKNYLTKNRNVRNISQNKTGHHDQTMGHSAFTQRTYLYRAIDIYNCLPRNLTLITKQHLFKKWCKAYNLNKNIKLKEQNDNFIIIIQPISDQNNLIKCFNNDDD